MKKAIAFFDFDGTITTKDSLLEFIRFTKGNAAFYAGFLRHLHLIVAYKLQLIGNQSFKETMLEHFYHGTPASEFDAQCALFVEKILPGIVRAKALDEMKKLKEDGSLVVVVSASPEAYLRKWGEPLGIPVIGSVLEIKNNVITGKITGKNCHGKEKVRRILEQHKMTDYEVIYAYGDTSGDRPMMKLATTSFYKPFRK